jgi:hypothetical protein
MRDTKTRQAIGRAAASISTVFDRMVADLPERRARASEPWLFRRVMEDTVAGRPQVVLMHDQQIAAIDAWIAMQWAYRRSRPPIPTDRDHLFRTIATSSAARVLTAPLDDGGDVSLLGVGQARREAVPVVNRRDPRATRRALTADAAARAGGPC